MAHRRGPHYSNKYFDDAYEYRHVILTKEMMKRLPANKLLSESEWRALGVEQSPGWIHYAIHEPEPHILLFRRLLVDSPNPPEGALQNAHSVIGKENITNR